MCFICQTFCELAWSTGNTFSGVYIMKCNNYNVASMGNMNSWRHAGGHFYTKLWLAYLPRVRELLMKVYGFSFARFSVLLRFIPEAVE